MIRDHRGKIPTIVVLDVHVLHQWTGLKVPFEDRYDRDEVLNAIKKLITLVNTGVSNANRHT